MKLKPCPFCGGEAKIAVDFGLFAQESQTCGCLKCGCRLNLSETRKKSIKAWNTRVEGGG